MIERFEIIIDSPLEDAKVKKMLVVLLGTWGSKFKNEQGMEVLKRLYDRGRGQMSSSTHSHDREVRIYT